MNYFKNQLMKPKNNLGVIKQKSKRNFVTNGFLYKTNSLDELVTHYDIGKANNDVCQGNFPFGNPIK